MLIVGSRRGEQTFGLGSALASAMRKVVAALPESHRDTATGAAQRLLIDPETDLLSHRLVAEEVPDGIGTEVRRAVLAGHKLRIHYAAMDFSDAEHAEWALWQLATHAEALAPQWLRTALRNRAAAIATCNEASSEC